jgi:putative ABC transport system substrate-binding protein
MGFLALPRVAATANKVHRIGILVPGATTSDVAGPEPRIVSPRAFVHGMRSLGYVYGENFLTEARGGEGKGEIFPRLVAEMVDLQVDVIVAPSPFLPAIKKATTSIPVVMAAAADAVEDGFALSLARPGGNFTGVSVQMAETTGKRLELLRELVPGHAPLAVLWEAPFSSALWRAAEAAARTRGWQVQSLEVREADEIERAFRAARDARAGALLVHPSGLLDRHATRITQLAVQYRLPAMYALPHYVESGGLMAYSPDLVAIWKRAAYYVDRILKGAKPGDLPIEQSTEFELSINLTAAAAIGLVVPQSFRLRASRVMTVPTPPPDGALK